MQIEKRIIFEGKSKTIFEGPEPDTLIVNFRDDVDSSFYSKKHSIIPNKGIINNLISEYIMERLTEISIPNHFIRRLNMREQQVHEAEAIPIELILYNYASGYLSKNLGIPEGTQLPRSIIEYRYKDSANNDPVVSEEHITAFGWADADDLDEMVKIALRVNDFLSGLFQGVGIKLIDFTLEFGKISDKDENTHIAIIDEITPDNCRLWDLKTQKRLDKDRFRKNLKNPEEAYLEIANRFHLLPKNLLKTIDNTKTGE